MSNFDTDVPRQIDGYFFMLRMMMIDNSVNQGTYHDMYLDSKGRLYELFSNFSPNYLHTSTFKFDNYISLYKVKFYDEFTNS